MRGRKPDQFGLTPKDERELRELLRDGQTPLKVARRAPILLGRTQDAQPVGRLSETVAQDRTTIGRVCDRYEPGGLEAALYDAPRAGRPRVFSLQRTAPA